MAAVLAFPPNLVSPTERLVLISLANHANREGPLLVPLEATIADETGLASADGDPASVTAAWYGADRGGRLSGPGS